jgi:hypothetical protein
MATTFSERSWWWEHGYRLCQVDNALPLTFRRMWVCKICVAKRKPPPIKYYRYIASIGKSVIRHFRDYRITRANIVGRDDRRPINQNSMAQYLQADINNPQYQKLLFKLALYVSLIRDLLLMDWIIADNLLFRLVNSPVFRRWAIYRNSGGSLPIRKIIASLLKEEYQRVIPYVKQMLQSARGLVYFIFDG